MNKVYYIYKITNLINGKIYIGKHSQKIQTKDSYFGSGVLLNKAIVKYGKENFKKEIIEICEKDNISTKEIYWINKFNSFTPNGYNLAKGGNGGNSTNNTHIYNNGITQKFLKETDNIPEGFVRGRLKHTIEARLKMSKQVKGKNAGNIPWNKGLDITNAKVKENALKAKNTIIDSKILKGKNNPRAKKFLFISPTKEQFEVFGNLKEFCKEHDLSYRSVKKYRNIGEVPFILGCNLSGWEVQEIKCDSVFESKKARLQHRLKLKESNLLTKRQQTISKFNIGVKDA